jgi:hypothetical protein
MGLPCWQQRCRSLVRLTGGRRKSWLLLLRLLGLPGWRERCRSLAFLGSSCESCHARPAAGCCCR